MSPLGLEMWMMQARAQIKKIYGAEAAALSYIPPPSGDRPGSAPRERLSTRLAYLERFVLELEKLPQTAASPHRGKKIFIGHGRSLLWRELKDFISERLFLPWDEFNREAVAGLTTVERWSQMLDEAAFAFLIMTAEDEHTDFTMHARENVVHEVGLFQGRLGPRRAIVLLEEGCKEFSNIHGLSQVRFGPGRMSSTFEDIRRVLEREGIIKT